MTCTTHNRRKPACMMLSRHTDTEDWSAINKEESTAGIDVVVGKDITDTKGLLKERYGATDNTTYLLRPDQHVAARWHKFDETNLVTALKRATAQA